ncbi:MULTISPECIES: Ail/Lom family outer membrane beta-barrel protein [Pantoea]|uniref:Ail/Lom family outer membrane beta-barrel protein n=1 Tax=Pantoea TaxID=53335 RepID=UPI000EA0EB50|nr:MULTISPECIES: Ail/Lom family outer membrane beta-barrel protein [Pantoea]MBZ6387915.1 Ail/Lom family outer membrane beta-barrel protein [Pantoea piersonii]MBZ6400017.1 Ail/Lom family outer membrane beta-barrel protein [Pantoea piersonii]MBZ6407904.1 Ail/Lom family outer membrane beta-barrel protein [Pantoea piersonii]MBZ6427535.1 Ail/Lom family outer membrane beta-barrel protein [Pantoea piersonii]NYB03139.1 Ail/Lom family outer membrane beta-barrel protein [Pantoea piersonii]
MKKSVFVSLVMLALGANVNAYADKHTFTLGYAQSKVQDFKDINGINLKYRYEWDSPLSLIGSLTWMSGSGSYTPDIDSMDRFDSHAKVKYYSLSVGPAWRFSQYISLYGLLGVNYNKVDYREGWYNYEGRYVYMGETRLKENKTSLMYGAGVQINPVENLAIDIGYEGSRLDVADKNMSINGFNVNLGYSF